MNPKVRIVEETRVVLKERMLPYSGKVNVRAGEHVSPNTVIAQTELLPGLPIYIDIAEELEIDTSDINNVLQCMAGDMVAQGDVLAKKNGKVIRAPLSGLVEHVSVSGGYLLLRQEVRKNARSVIVDAAKLLGTSAKGLKKFMRVKTGDYVVRSELLAGEGTRWLTWVPHAVLSPTKGTVGHISYDNGTIEIVMPYEPTIVYANLMGVVKEVKAGYGATIEATGALAQGVFGIGGEHYGKLEVLVKSPSEQITENMILPEHKDKVIIGGAGITYEALQKALEIEVSAIVVGGLKSEYLVRMFGKKVAIGVTGDEDVSTSLLVTERFGEVPISDQIFSLAKKYEGSMAAVNGRSRLRAGIELPELIIFH